MGAHGQFAKRSQEPVGIGILVPSVNRALEMDASLLHYPGISFHFHRLKMQRDTEEELRRLEDNAVNEVHLLKDAEVSAVGFGCTSGGFLHGYAYEKDLKRRLEDAAGVPVQTPGNALIEGLKESNVENIAIVSPYSSWLVDRGIDYFSAAGINTVASSSFSAIEGSDIARLSPRDISSKAHELVATQPGIEAVVLLCTAMRGLEAITHCEASGVPCFSSNQAFYWSLGRLAQASPNPHIPGLLGKIL